MDGNSLLIDIGKYFKFNPLIMRPDPVVVEIGSWDLGFARIVKEHCPGLRYYIYEADWQNFEMLNREARGVDWVTPINKAIADQTGTKIFHRYNSRSAGSLFGPSRKLRPSHILYERCNVTTTSMQDIIDAVGGQIDLLICNCEGGELYALEPLLMLENAQRVKQLAVSFHHKKNVALYPESTTKKLLNQLRAYYDIEVLSAKMGYYRMTLRGDK